MAGYQHGSGGLSKIASIEKFDGATERWFGCKSDLEAFAVSHGDMNLLLDGVELISGNPEDHSPSVSAKKEGYMKVK